MSFAFRVTLLLLGLSQPSLGADMIPPRELLHSQAVFSFRLLDRLESQSPAGSNIIISPAGVAAALLLMNVGADEAMHAAIIRTLRITSGSNADAVASRGDLRELLSKITEDSSTKGTLSIANALLVDPSIRPVASTVSDMRRTGAEILLARVNDKSAIDHLNNWVARKTRGLITGILDYRERRPGLVAISALYFSGLWSKPFPKRNTHRQAFYGFAGDADVLMMSILDGSSFDLRTEGRFAAVDLPYSGGRYRIVVVTTLDKPARFNEFLSVMDWIEGERFVRNQAHVMLPRITLIGETNLADSLEALGLNTGNASSKPFARLSDMQLDISGIAQRTYMQIDERGTKAAATTVIEVEEAAARDPFEMRVDRPFIFGLRDSKTGLILMSGYVARPRVE